MRIPWDTDITRLEQLYLVITNHCTSHCLLCSYWRQKKKKFLSYSFISKYVIPLLHKYHVNVVCISGGEPTFHPQLPQIVRTIKKNGSEVGIITNCTNLSSVFGRIKNYIEAYMLPLDGDTEVIYREIKGINNFSEVISWPKKIKENNPSTKVMLSCLIQKKNVNRIVNIYRLASKLPVDALFFRVPELKNNCFGRVDDIPSESLENAYLNKNEIQNLKESFRKILKLDLKRKILFQNEELFKRFVKYFKLLRGEKVKFVDRLCSVPFTSVVIDESKNISPCFYLHFFIRFQKKNKDFINNAYLKNIRKKLVRDTKFRNTYCSNCLQCLR